MTDNQASEGARSQASPPTFRFPIFEPPTPSSSQTDATRTSDDSSDDVGQTFADDTEPVPQSEAYAKTDTASPYLPVVELDIDTYVALGFQLQATEFVVADAESEGQSEGEAEDSEPAFEFDVVDSRPDLRLDLTVDQLLGLAQSYALNPSTLPLPNSPDTDAALWIPGRNPFEPLASGMQQGWKETLFAVIQMSAGDTPGERLHGLGRLAELAQSGDPHAATALAATLMALTTPPEMQAAAGFSDSPVFMPHVGNLSAAERKLFTDMTVQALTNSFPLLVEAQGPLPTADSERQLVLKLPPGLAGDPSYLPPLSDAGVTALSTSYMALSATGHTEQAERILELLGTATRGEGSLDGLLTVLRSRSMPENKELMSLFVERLSDSSNSDAIMDQLARGAVRGSEQDIEILSQILASPESSEEQLAAGAAALRVAAKNGLDHEVLSALTDSYNENGDQGKLLDTMAALAEDGSIDSRMTVQVKAFLQEGIQSDDQATQTSATEGWMRLSSQWTTQDLSLLSENMNPALAEGLIRKVEELNPDTAKELARQITEKLSNQSYTTVSEQTAAVTALGALADFAPEAAAQAIRDAAINSEFTGSNDRDLTLASVRALMRLGGSQGESSEAALRLLTESGWESSYGLPLGDQAFRQELADFVTGDVASSDLSDKAKDVVHDSGLPQSIPSLFRDLGVAPERLEELVSGARSNYSDSEIRTILARVAMFNHLPWDMQQEVRGTSSEDARMALGKDASGRPNPDPDAETIDAITVIGQMANGKLSESTNGIVATPIEDTVQELIKESLQDQAALDRKRQDLEERMDDQLGYVVDHTKEGVSRWDRIKSWFGDLTVRNFDLTQEVMMDQYVAYIHQMKTNDERSAEAQDDESSLDLASDLFNFDRLSAGGQGQEADLLALEMLREHGFELSQVSPEVWQTLGYGDNPDSDTVWERLHEQGLAQSGDTPFINLGSAEGLAQAMFELSKDRDESFVDTAARRDLAFQAIDSDPALMLVQAAGLQMQTDLAGLQQLVAAGLGGSRSDGFVEDVRELTTSFEQMYRRMTTADASGKSPVERAAEQVRLMREGLADADPSVQEELSERIEAIENMLEFFDPNSQHGKNLELMFSQVKSGDFDPSSFATMGGAVKVLATIAAGVAVAAALPYVLATVPVWASIAAGVSGGIIGHEVAAELLHKYSNDRTGALFMHARRNGLVVGPDGQAQELTELAALGQYGIEFTVGTIGAIATLRLGGLFREVLASGKGPLRVPSLARFATRAQKVEQVAAQNGNTALMQKWMASFAGEFQEEVIQETMQQGLDLGLEGVLGDTNPVLAVMASALIASRTMNGGFDLVRGRGGQIEIDIEEGGDVAATLAELRRQMIQDGLTVDWDGNANSTLTVRTPEGGTITVKARTADGAGQEGGAGGSGASENGNNGGSDDNGGASDDTTGGEGETGNNEAADGNNDDGRPAGDDTASGEDNAAAGGEGEVAASGEGDAAAGDTAGESPSAPPPSSVEPPVEDWTPKMREAIAQKFGSEVAEAAERLGLSYQRLAQLSKTQIEDVKQLVQMRDQLATQLASATTPNDNLTQEQWQEVLNSIDTRLRGDGGNNKSGEVKQKTFVRGIDDSLAVLSQITNADTSKERATALADVLVVSSKLPADLELPLAQLADAPTNVLQTYASLASQLPGMSGQQGRLTGHLSEWQAFRNIFRVFNQTSWGQNSGWTFLPTGQHSVADSAGVDGVFINLESGETRLVNFKQRPESTSNPFEFAIAGSGLADGNLPLAQQSVQQFLNQTQGLGLDASVMEQLGLPSLTEDIIGNIDDLADRLPQLQAYQQDLQSYIQSLEATGESIPEGLKYLAKYVDIAVQGTADAVNSFQTPALTPPVVTGSTPTATETGSSGDSTGAGSEPTPLEAALAEHDMSQILSELPEGWGRLQLTGKAFETGLETDLILEIAPSEAYPNGAVLKITNVTGNEGWVDSWGNRQERPFDAPLKDGPIALADGRYAYIQPLADIPPGGVSDSHPGWAKFEQKMLDAGFVWADGRAEQVGIDPKTGDLILLDYSAVVPKDSQHQFDIIDQVQEVEEQIDDRGAAGSRTESDNYDDMGTIDTYLMERRALALANPPEAEWRPLLQELFNGDSFREMVDMRMAEGMSENDARALVKEVRAWSLRERLWRKAD